MIRFACPYCRKELVDLKCFPCNFEGKFEDGIYHLHRSDSSWDACVDQATKLEASIIAEKKINRAATYAVTCPEHNVASQANIAAQERNFVNALEFLKPIQGKMVIDMGMGGSKGSKMMAFVDLGAELAAGIDFRLADNVKSTDKLVFVFGDNYYVPFLDESFDIVLDSATLHHMLDKLAYLKEIYRLLKPGGIFYSYGSSPSPTPEKLAAMKGHQKWWMETYGIYELAWGIDECRDVFSKVFTNPFTISYLEWFTPKGSLAGEDAVIWCKK